MDYSRSGATRFASGGLSQRHTAETIRGQKKGGKKSSPAPPTSATHDKRESSENTELRTIIYSQTTRRSKRVRSGIEFFVVTDARRVTQPKTPAEALLARDGFLALLGLSLLLVPGDLTQAAALADVRLTGELKSMSTAFARMRDRSTPAPWPTKLGRRR